MIGGVYRFEPSTNVKDCILAFDDWSDEWVLVEAVDIRLMEPDGWFELVNFVIIGEVAVWFTS